MNLTPEQTAALQRVIAADAAQKAAKAELTRATDDATRVIPRGTYVVDGCSVQLLGFGHSVITRLGPIGGATEQVSWDGVRPPSAPKPDAEDYYIEHIEP